MDRPTWDEYFIEITLDVAKRATCLRAQVGAFIVKDKRILTTGYNGAPKGLPHCLEVGCEIVDGHCVRTLHAEQRGHGRGNVRDLVRRGHTAFTGRCLGVRTAFRSLSGPLPCHGSREFVAVFEGTRFAYRLVLRPTGLLRLLEPLLRVALARQVRADLRRLKQRLEAGSPGA